MHSAGVIGKKHAASGGSFNKLPKTRFSGEIVHGSSRPNTGSDVLTKASLTCRSEQRHRSATGPSQMPRRFREALRQPTFCISVSRARAHADHRWFQTNIAQ